MRRRLALYGLIDPERTNGRDLDTLAYAAVSNGVTLLQYRDKHASDDKMRVRAAAIRDATAGSGVPLLINDRVEIAAAIGADGVHLG
ncbi:MAG: thiamine phosphate synthase, partial [Hyphomicrobiales bacterium]|nr:thiamine phosphate synthase [Hyphomicrobiales bacterium]